MAIRFQSPALGGSIAVAAVLVLAPSAMATSVYRDADGLHVEADAGEDN